MQQALMHFDHDTVSVDLPVYREWMFMCEYVVNAYHHSANITIQQDNTRPHIPSDSDVARFVEEVTSFYPQPENGNFKIKLTMQPPNSQLSSPQHL